MIHKDGDLQGKMHGWNLSTAVEWWAGSYVWWSV